MIHDTSVCVCVCQGEKTLQAMPGVKPAIITASRPITKMIVTQPKSLGAGVQPSTKIIPTKIVYGQQGKTQVRRRLTAVNYNQKNTQKNTFLLLEIKSNLIETK